MRLNMVVIALDGSRVVDGRDGINVARIEAIEQNARQSFFISSSAITDTGVSIHL